MGQKVTIEFSNNDELKKELITKLNVYPVCFPLSELLRQYGIIAFSEDEGSIRDHNVGGSDYSEHLIQPWAIWQDWNLNPWDADIIKRVLRKKDSESRKQDYMKIIHICEERIRQIRTGFL